MVELLRLLYNRSPMFSPSNLLTSSVTRYSMACFKHYYNWTTIKFRGNFETPRKCFSLKSGKILKKNEKGGEKGGVLMVEQLKTTLSKPNSHANRKQRRLQYPFDQIHNRFHHHCVSIRISTIEPVNLVPSSNQVKRFDKLLPQSNQILSKTPWSKSSSSTLSVDLPSSSPLSSSLSSLLPYCHDQHSPSRSIPLHGDGEVLSGTQSISENVSINSRPCRRYDMNGGVHPIDQYHQGDRSKESTFQDQHRTNLTSTTVIIDFLNSNPIIVKEYSGATNTTDRTGLTSSGHGNISTRPVYISGHNSKVSNNIMGLMNSKSHHHSSNGCACSCSPIYTVAGEFCRKQKQTAFSGNPIYSNHNLSSSPFGYQKRWFSNCVPKMSEVRGIDILNNNRLTKGLCFTSREREQFKMKGLLPPAIRSQEQEAKVAMNYLNTLESDISKYMFMRELQDRNERLFYKLLCQYTDQLMPIVYTPVVGEACLKYSSIFQRPRGMFISIHDAGHISSILNNWPDKDIKAIVVTDGERILGLGDLGANGMGIPVGKLSLYTALAGIPPHQTLPVTLDVGTNNQEFLNDPNYIGLKQKRVRGPQYDDFIDEFMEAVIKRWGRSCLIQFEDFGNSNAFRLLEKYLTNYCTFNDDIQGTASVCVAGIIASCKLTGMKISQHRFFFFGAGEAALGIAELLVMAMEKEGCKTKDAQDRIWMMDSKGLVTTDRKEMDKNKAKFAKKAEPLKNLEQIIDLVQPTALIGVAAQPKAFNETVLKKMASINKQPLIFPLSNPTSKAECTAEEAYKATEGRCIFASGSPFDPVEFGGKTFHPGQGNNSYIFPGVSLAVIACGVHYIPNEAFLVAARALADQVNKKDLDLGRIYPPLSDIREVSLVIAAKVAQYFYVESLANERPEPEDKLLLMRSLQYDYNFNGAN